MSDLRVKFTAAGVALKAPSFGRRFYTPMILASLFLLAFATRAYRLYSFPYFPQEEPWLGSNPEGLYRDEADRYLKESESLFERLPVYQPPLFLFFMNLSLRAFGTPYAIRVPSAVASSLVAVLIYLVSMKKFGSRGASVASALYFIAMFPALIYNRMAFLENGVALFLLASYYCLLIYEGCGKERWLYLSGVLAVLGALSKINGAVAPLFFLAYGLYKGFFRKALKVTVLVFAISAVSLLAFLYLSFMYPIDIEALYPHGIALSMVTGKLSHLSLTILGIPVSYVENPLPVFTVTTKTGETAPFIIDVPCMGAQQVIGYVAFAVFLMLVTQKPSLLHKVIGFALGLLLMPVIAILLIAYEYGTEVALSTFHTFGGWVLFTMGIVIYLLLIEWLTKRSSLKIDLGQLVRPLLRPRKTKATEVN